MTRIYGWRPDKPDIRDHWRLARFSVAELPPHVDLTPQMPPVYDQGELGSCTANAIAAAIEYARRKQKLSDFTPSRLFIYYNERAMEGTIDSDAGAEIRDGIKFVASQGACNETDWPYEISQFKVVPPTRCYIDAKDDLVGSYARVEQNAASIRQCLAAGHPVVFGIMVYESFESEVVASSGVVPMPAAKETALGGHAVLIVGYDDPSQMFIVRNSWGPGWGKAGYFMMPYAYVINNDLADDFWQIDTISGDA